MVDYHFSDQASLGLNSSTLLWVLPIVLILFMGATSTIVAEKGRPSWRFNFNGTHYMFSIWKLNTLRVMLVDGLISIEWVSLQQSCLT